MLVEPVPMGTSIQSAETQRLDEATEIFRSSATGQAWKEFQTLAVYGRL